jgi:hypothetical protein
MGTFFGALALAVGAATGPPELRLHDRGGHRRGRFFGNNLGPSVEAWPGWLTSRRSVRTSAARR